MAIEFSRLEAADVCTLETQIRRMLRSDGYGLRKSCCRNPDQQDFGRYMIYDLDTGVSMSGSAPTGYKLDLEYVYRWVFDDYEDTEDTEN